MSPPTSDNGARCVPYGKPYVRAEHCGAPHCRLRPPSHICISSHGAPLRHADTASWLVLQAAVEQNPAGQSPALHMPSGPSAGPPPGSLLNVQNLYHLQLTQAPLNQPGLHSKPQATPSLLHLTQQLEQDQQQQQHLGAADQLEQQQELLGRLDDTDTGEAGIPLPSNTDYKHKPRRKATERPSVSSSILGRHTPRMRMQAACCVKPGLKQSSLVSSHCT